MSTRPLSPIFGISPETVRENNAKLMELYSLYLHLAPRAISADTVRDIAACGVPLAEAMAHALAAYFALDTLGADRDFFTHWLLPSIEHHTPATYTRDAYFTHIQIPEARLGAWHLTHEEIAPFEPFVCRDLRVLPDGRMLPQLAFFDTVYPFPAILEGGREWMTLQPNEMVTTYPALGEASGKVLTFGVGLGFFAYHASENPRVESVTVVDISADALSLFATHILPQFPHREKVHLVQRDAFAFAAEMADGAFDFVFADIWHDAGDGKDLYLRFKAIEPRFRKTRFTYWLEDTIKAYLDPTLWPLA